ncbi:helix-turn-helix domain-containing protein [Metapseudomonas otitidis]|uniref:helix-turn-helix domain-containing protein n=1 Tax=Metapseudomonas otitidis TaxID=319939 RepID=UPI0024486C7E|nr:XRE family transcriptional regulator [Pseudomonas otitidis]MDH0337606.1 XRE family transcriptional regulator [Pseudomonas otitidis]
MTAPNITYRLHHLRHTNSLTQEELAKKLGFKDRQTLSQIENGERKLSSAEMVRASEVFGVPLDYFTDPFELAGEGHFSWRENGTKAELLDEFELRAGRWIAAYRHLSKLKGRVINSSTRRIALNRQSTFEEAIAEGEAMGKALGLGNIPSEKLAYALAAELDTLVLEVDTAPGISGAACRLSQLNAIVINRQETAARRNYDMAHELFHLLTWDTMPPPRLDTTGPKDRKAKRVEQLADNFAAGLLMPTALIEKLIEASELPKGPSLVAWLNSNAQMLGVSAIALQWRLVNMGKLSKASMVNEDLIKNNGDTNRPKPPAKFGKDFMEVIGWGLDEGHVSVRRISSLLNVTIDELSTIFENHALQIPYDL